MNQNDEHEPNLFVSAITGIAVFATVTGVLTLAGLLLTKWLG